VKWSYRKLILWSALVFLSSGWIVFYINTGTRNSSAVLSPLLILFSGLSAVTFLLLLILFWRHQSDHLQASVFPVVTLVPLTLWHFNGTGVLALRNQQPGQALVVPLVVLNSSGCLDYLTGKKGKNDPNIYVLDRDNMGKFNPNAEGDNIYQLLRGLVCSGGEFGKPSYFNTTVCYGAVGDALKAFRSQMPNWRPRPVRKAQTSFRIQERHPPLTPMALPTALCGRLKTGVLPSCTVTMPRILRPNSHGSLTPLTLAPGWRLA